MSDDPSFLPDLTGLSRALELLQPGKGWMEGSALPDALPSLGVGDREAIERLAPHVLGAAARLYGPQAFAHMDPPTPWLTWALTLWNARLNQNLLHPATAPFARSAEERVVAWLAPFFGMEGGHMTPCSTVANLTALWAARDTGGAKRFIASDAAHLSIRKAAHLLGMDYVEVGTDALGRLDVQSLPTDLSDACLVLTAGATSIGAIDPLVTVPSAAWTHVDAAWAGPLRLSDRYGSRLAGLERADSVAVSAHKWLFQPKESALVMFRHSARAHDALGFGGAYLASPNIGVLGSHGATAVPLLGLLLAWGRSGLAARIDHCMAMSERLADAIADAPGLDLFARPETGVVVFRPVSVGTLDMLRRLPANLASTTVIQGETWLRCVAANPQADINVIISNVCRSEPRGT